jgi:hypothetical protein
MKKIVVILVILFQTNICVFASSPNELYVPTKLEWLVMDLNGKNDIRDSKRFGFSLYYYEKNSDTVIIRVFYKPDVNNQIMEEYLNSDIGHIQRLAEISKLDGVKVEVEKTELSS